MQKHVILIAKLRVRYLLDPHEICNIEAAPQQKATCVGAFAGPDEQAARQSEGGSRAAGTRLRDERAGV